jgi:hypothetical protein
VTCGGCGLRWAAKTWELQAWDPQDRGQAEGVAAGKACDAWLKLSFFSIGLFFVGLPAEQSDTADCEASKTKKRKTQQNPDTM